jgi:hypothetical protein
MQDGYLRKDWPDEAIYVGKEPEAGVRPANGGSGISNHASAQINAGLRAVR